MREESPIAAITVHITIMETHLRRRTVEIHSPIQGGNEVSF